MMDRRRDRMLAREFAKLKVVAMNSLLFGCGKRLQQGRATGSRQKPSPPQMTAEAVSFIATLMRSIIKAFAMVSKKYMLSSRRY
jgi:hypothetical protein